MMRKIVIIGAGLAGSALAIALSHNKDLEIKVFETKRFKVLDIEQCLQTRPISLTHANVKWLETLGVWPELEEYARPIKKLDISQAGYFGKCVVDADDFDLPALAWVVPAALLQQVLQQHAQSLTEVSFIEQLTDVADNSISFIADSRQQTADYELLVAADGSNSSVRDFLNIKTTSHDFNEFAFSGILQLKSKGCLQVAFERFTDKGVVAVLPRDDNSAGLVWTMPDNIAKSAQDWSEEQWTSEFNSLLPLDVTRCNITASFALQSKVAECMHCKNSILLGNSAHTFYPIAAQGFNLALRDAMTVCDLLSNAQWSARSVARQYSKLRAIDCENVRKLTHWSAALFALRLPGVAHLRGIALAALGASRCLQQRLIDSGFGKVGQVPSGLFDE